MALPRLNAPGVTPALDARDELGEGPHWDVAAGELLRVDIARGLVHGWDPRRERGWTIALDAEVSAAIPSADGGELLVAVEHELILLTRERTRRTIATLDAEPADNRFNDCRCDARGRLWAGTMSRSRNTGAGALYRLAPGGELERVLDGTTISNGLGWSPAGDRMYFVDSPTQRIDVFDYDIETGALGERRPLVEIDAADGMPDGLTVDAEGGVWVSLFGGGAIHRYDPTGALAARIALPVTYPTCPAFGGPRLATLYVTSARHRLSPAQRRAEPLAGAVLALEPGVHGLAVNRFGSG
jgi:sugar lactone lactonase YvrE